MTEHTGLVPVEPTPPACDHEWPGELIPDACCEVCGLPYGEFGEYDEAEADEANEAER